MQIDWFTFTAQIVNFLILLLLLRRFLYKPVIAAMDRREKRISDEKEDARQKMVDANEKESEYEKKLTDFDRKKEKMMKEAKEEVEQNKKEMMSEAREEIEEQQQRWEEALSGEQDAFLHELQKETGDKIIDIVRQILDDLTDRKLEDQVFEIFVRELSGMDEEENKKFITSALDYGQGIIEVKSSYELGDNKKNQILDILKKKVAPGVECNFEVTPTLGFGIEMRAGGWRAGWSLNGYIAKLREGMEESFTQKVTGQGTSENQNKVRNN